MKRVLVFIFSIIIVLVSMTGCFFLKPGNKDIESSRSSEVITDSSEVINTSSSSIIEPSPSPSIPVSYSKPVEKQPQITSPVELYLEQEYKYDLDGDDRKEQLVFNMKVSTDPDFMDNLEFSVKTEGTNETYTFETRYAYDPIIFLADFDKDDPYLEVIISGDIESTDYETICLRYKEGKFYNLAFYSIFTKNYENTMSGYVNKVTDDSIEFDVTMDVLGTYTAIVHYTYDDINSTFDCSGNQIYEFYREDNAAWWDNHGITTIADLPVTLFTEDGTEEITELKAGNTILITGTDHNTNIEFITKDGHKGRINSVAISRTDDYYGVIIAGFPETYFFDYLPYAG